MTSEAPATALAAAIAATNFRHDDESGLAKFNLLAFSLLHQHGPALAAALRCRDALAELVALKEDKDKIIMDDALTHGARLTLQLEYAKRMPLALAAARDALSARVDDTPTRGTPT